MKSGGPERCERPCVECPDGLHHFGEYFGRKDSDDPDDEDSGPDHPAAKAGLEMWRTCKHCPAWQEVFDPDDDDGDDDFDSDDADYDSEEW